MTLTADQQKHILETLRAFHLKVRSLVGTFKKEAVQMIEASDEKKEETVRAKIVAF